MDLHNIMEDVILDYLAEILEAKKNICKCEQCKLDMACYALNKVKPMYVVSSRGIIHRQNQKRLNYQEEIDTYSIITEAVDVVSKTRRHNDIQYDAKNVIYQTEEIEYHSGDACFYNFPQIVGRVLDCQTLLPISDVEVTLNYDTSDNAVKMFNGRWKNPLTIVSQMEGLFSFWSAPEFAEKEGIQKEFQLNLKIKKEGFEEIRRFFQIRLISTKELNRFIKSENIFQIEDIYLYPEGVGEEEEFNE
ncbi:MAG: hypothetical protein A2086_17000 [Spirochaetes bacterium GWD1_27_9]|nr:MAG: hypothetical protein A2Z98_15325 [Spirochaetes bacterium GWB1_27_13]OHD27654.1 MAG: hypothetical protein A2Y34_10680 [Spirochaetes bacterium GWC1_27_15]OHD33328.1 MAG: hypothetical protein A2086_17000 [Spirochaetes bacterium GWD1_27_9]